MEEALVHILTPKRQIDIMKDVLGAKDLGKPYVILFVGVSVVEKTTNLVKVIFGLVYGKVVADITFNWCL